MHSLLRWGVEAAWCSTWGNAANSVYRPLLDPTLPELPLAVDVDEHEAPAGMRSQRWWKLEALRDKNFGRPLVWIDDLANARVLSGEPAPDSQWHDAPLLVIAPDPRIGLTAAEMRRVHGWLDEVG